MSVRGRKWFAYLELVRAPNLFTAAADVTMGLLVARGELSPFGVYLRLLGASCSLYAAGVVLNDVFDVETDRRERPRRPLPSGRVSREAAARLGGSLLIAGVLLGAAAGWRSGAETGWRSALVALLLAGCILLYDAVLKETRAGPLLMGACRALNVLLGMSVAAATAAPPAALLRGWPLSHLAIAAGIGLHVAGVAWMARGETASGGRGRLLLGLGVMAAGWAVLVLLPQSMTAAERAGLHLDPSVVWPALLLLLTVPILRRSLAAVIDPTPRRVQAAVRLGILSLALLDAAVCLLAAGGPAALGVLSLLIPALLLGRWIRMT